MKLQQGQGNIHFATPIYRGKMEGIEDLNAELKALFLEKERQGKENPAAKNTTLGSVFDSTADLFTWPEEPVQKLRHVMHSMMTSWVKDVNQFDSATLQQLRFRYESWFHITRKGGCKTLHNHGNFSWAMVYYVDDGGPVPAEFPRSGMIQFYDPRRVYQNGWDVGLQGLDAQTRFGGFSVQPESGSFVIFPGYLDHEVLTYHGDSQRIMVALNCAVVTPDAPEI